MNMFEEAAVLEGMIKMRSESQSEIAKKLGVSQSYVANKLRLLKLEKDVRESIIEAGLTERHARAILRLEDSEKQREALKLIAKDGLNVEKTEALVDYLHTSTIPERINQTSRIKRIELFKSTLGKSLDTLVSLGVDAKSRTTYYGTKTYITISIDEIG